MLWIPVEDGDIVEDLGEGSIDPVFAPAEASGRSHRRGKALPIELTRIALSELDSYNQMPPSPVAKVGGLTPERFDIALRVEDVYLPASVQVELARLFDWIRPYYTWADRRAVAFQRWYAFGVFTVFGAAAAAVLSAALEAVLHIGLFIAVEAGLLCCIGAVVYIGRRVNLHDQWINSRFLAERFRSAVFLKAAGIAKPDGDIDSRAFRGELTDWLRRAYERVWRSGPEPEPGRTQAPIENVRTLLADGWIQPQVDYFAAKSRANDTRDRRMLVLSMTFFALTLVLALVHVANWLDGFAPEHLTNVLSVLATSLPAFGAGVAGVSAHMQYRRHAAVYNGMARQLEVVRQRILRAPTYWSIRSDAAEADEIMAIEQRDWHGIMRFTDLDVG